MAPEANDTRIDMPWHSAGETVETLASTPVPADASTLDPAATGARQLRLRRITVEPGGVIAVHGHERGPAVSWILSGTLLEFRADHAEAIEHRGPAAITHDVEHWWRNPGDEPAVIIEADLCELDAGSEEPGPPPV